MTATLVYDGDCAFCSSSVRVLLRLGPRATVVPWQRADLDALGLTVAQCSEAVQWVDGPVRRSGAAAVAAVLRSCGPVWRGAGRLLGTRAGLSLGEPVYRWVAEHRHRLPGGTPACKLPPAA